MKAITAWPLWWLSDDTKIGACGGGGDIEVARQQADFIKPFFIKGDIAVAALHHLYKPFRLQLAENLPWCAFNLFFVIPVSHWNHSLIF